MIKNQGTFSRQFIKITGFGNFDYFTFMKLFTIHLPILTEVSPKRSPIDKCYLPNPHFPAFGPGFGEIRKWSNKMLTENFNLG